MSMQIINGYKIGDKFKSAVARLVEFDETETIKGDNLQDALESVDADIRNSIVTDGDDIDIDISPIDADTLGGKYTAADIEQIITNLSGLIKKIYVTGEAKTLSASSSVDWDFKSSVPSGYSYLTMTFALSGSNYGNITKWGFGSANSPVLRIFGDAAVSFTPTVGLICVKNL